MGKINGCLKCFFIFFNVLFAKIGCLLILSAIMSSVYIDQVNSRVWSWVFAIGVLGISWLGIYAGSFEKEILLKIFAGFTGIGIIIMLIFGIIMVVTRNKIESSFDSTESFMKNEELREMLNHLLEIAMGLYFGFAVTALLGLLLSLLMIRQVRRHDGSGETSVAMRRY